MALLARASPVVDRFASSMARRADVLDLRSVWKTEPTLSQESKTLGQVAYEASGGILWDELHVQERVDLEQSASAVARVVRERALYDVTLAFLQLYGHTQACRDALAVIDKVRSVS